MSDSSLARDTVNLPADGGTMDAFICRAEGRRPAVIVAHEIFGVSDYIRDVCCRLAGQGYVALAPDLFWEIGPPPEFSDRASFMRFRSQMDDPRFLASLDVAVDHLREQPFVDADHIGIVGFCMGGYYAFLEAARNPHITAVVDFYGGPLVAEKTETRPVTTMEAARTLSVPLLGLFGAEDQGIPVEQVRELERVVAEAGVPCEFHIYPGAEHAFHNDTGARYNAEAAKDAWERTLSFFGQYLH